MNGQKHIPAALIRSLLALGVAKTANGRSFIQMKPSPLCPTVPTNTASFDAEYESLPESLKVKYSKVEYAWMGEQRRANLIDEECLPDPEE